MARAYGTVRVLAEIKAAGEGKRWDEVRWEGSRASGACGWCCPTGAGGRSGSTGSVLKGEGPMRQFMPYVPVNGSRSAAVKYPLNFLWSYERARADLGPLRLAKPRPGRWPGRGGGENFNQAFPDQVYLIVQQGAEPTTYKAVLLWRDPA